MQLGWHFCRAECGKETPGIVSGIHGRIIICRNYKCPRVEAVTLRILGIAG
jgi:hypothetical protein